MTDRLNGIVLPFLLGLLCSGWVNHGHAQTLEPVRLQLKWFSSFQFAGYYMADYKGFYRDAGLAVTILERNPSHNHIEQVLNGEADYGIGDSALLRYRAHGYPVQVMASIFQHSAMVFLTRGGEQGILSPHDLKGRIVSYQNELDDAPLLALLYEAGLSLEDFQYAPLDFTDQAFIDGRVDAQSAYLSDQPFRLRQLGIPFNILNPLSYGIDFYGDILFASESTLRDQPERSQRFLEASLQGWRYALANPEETIDILRSHYGARNPVDHLIYEAEMTQRLIAPDLVDLGYTSINRFRQIAQVYQTLGSMTEMQSEQALQQLIWDPLSHEKRHTQYLILSAIITLLALILSGVAFWGNQRLKLVIARKTHELMTQQQMVDRYVLISETDLKGHIRNASQAFCQRSGFRRDELIGKSFHNTPPRQEIRDRLQRGGSWEGELEHRSKHGESYWTRSHVEAIYDAHGHPCGYRTVSQDITDRKALEKLAVTDPLTGLGNRMKLDQQLLHELARAQRYQQPFSLLLLDIDYFKQINDQYGHQQGDQVLQAMARLLENTLRSSDCIGRWGGEEFLVICPNTDLEEARQCAEKLRRAVEQAQLGPTATLTVSIGVSTYQTGDDDNLLLKRADQALYNAKRLGRNQVQIQR